MIWIFIFSYGILDVTQLYFQWNLLTEWHILYKSMHKRCIRKKIKTKKIFREVIFINQGWWHDLSWGLEYEIDNILSKWSPSRDGTLVLRCINLWILFPVVTCNFFVGWIKSMFMVYYALEYIVRYKLYVATLKLSTFLFDFLLRILYWGAIKFTIDSF